MLVLYVLYNLLCKTCISAGSSTGPSDLNVVAMAISGFTGDDRNVLWREQCRSIGAGLSNPYLRALFAFLTIASGESYEAILVSCVLTVFIGALVVKMMVSRFIHRVPDKKGPL